MQTTNTNNTEKEFGLSSWAIDNKTVIYVMIMLFLVMGLKAYFSMPREDFPEVTETKIYITLPYPGNTAEDVEKLMVSPIEDQLSSLSGVVKITSTSQENYGMILVEFDESLDVAQAKQRVKDKVDAQKANEDWPTFNNAKVEPSVFDISISEEQPIMNINIKGDYSSEKLKEYAELLSDEIESYSEIKAATVRGAQDKEIEIAIDIYKMMAAHVSFNDILSSIGNGNISLSAGNLITQNKRQIIRLEAEIKKPSDLNRFIVKNFMGTVYLEDIATVRFKEKQRNTYAREAKVPVVMLDVKKRSGQNMINAARKIREFIKKVHGDILPKDLEISISNDKSSKTLNQVDDLVNNIIFGVILVVGVLMFFLGFRNALFVGFAIPMSMFMSFMILSAMGYTMNTMILFGLIMGLGMLVDNGIVVVENVYRLMQEEGYSRWEAAKKGIGEIAFPIIISTATTVAAFIPLGIWPGIMGQFMIYFPITLSVVLGSSLFVAFFINSMLVSQFMKIRENKLSIKQLLIWTLILGMTGGVIFTFGKDIKGVGTLCWATAIFMWLYTWLLNPMSNFFQDHILTTIEKIYEAFLNKILSHIAIPWITSIGTLVILIGVFSLFGNSIASKRTKIEFFPDNTPNQIVVYLQYPQGTPISKTNNTTKTIEDIVWKVLNQPKYIDNGYNFLVESMVAQVGKGSGNPMTDMGNSSEMPHRGKITASMREYKYRRGLDSETLRSEVQKALEGKFIGLEISVEKDPVGPPVGYPINIEIEGKNYEALIDHAKNMKDFIDKQQISGIAGLKIDVNKEKSGKQVRVNREKAGSLGLAAGQIGMQLRNSLFGAKAGTYKKDGEDYDINLRFNQKYKYDQQALFNQNITFRDMNTGRLKEIPIMTVIEEPQNTNYFSAIKHKNGKRVVTLYSGLAPGFTDAKQVVDAIREKMKNFGRTPKGIKVDYTGQIEEQQKQMNFLVGAFFSGLGLIFLLLIFQFNGISKPTIIMIAIFYSFIGVFGGILITGAPFVIMMTMMGIISLAGIVVNNGVVLLDYTQLLVDRKLSEKQETNDKLLKAHDIIPLIVRGGKARLRPVLLTAITTVLGLIPLAIGFNIDFFSLFSEFDPKIYIGGDNVIFWGPLAKCVIYGLIIATFLTLVVVPAMYYIVHQLKYFFYKNKRLT